MFPLEVLVGLMCFFCVVTMWPTFLVAELSLKKVQARTA